MITHPAKGTTTGLCFGCVHSDGKEVTPLVHSAIRQLLWRHLAERAHHRATSCHLIHFWVVRTHSFRLQNLQVV
jgi:hypothetical protein